MRRRVGPTLLVVVAIFGFGTVVFAFTRNYAVAFLALVVISAADMISMFIRGSLVPLATPEDQLGRVTAVEGVFIGASNELGAFESGVAAKVFGLPWSIALGGIMTMLIATSFAWLFPSLRRGRLVRRGAAPEAVGATELTAGRRSAWRASGTVAPTVADDVLDWRRRGYRDRFRRKDGR